MVEIDKFIFRTNYDKTSYITATYFLESITNLNLYEISKALALGQSIGNPEIRSVYETEELFERPLHPYTQILLASAPKIRVRTDKPRIPNAELRTDIGEVPSPIDIPKGCPFHPRCPERFDPCDKMVPELSEPVSRGINGRLVSCHLWNPH